MVILSDRLLRTGIKTLENFVQVGFCVFNGFVIYQIDLYYNTIIQVQFGIQPSFKDPLPFNSKTERPNSQTWAYI